jgi:apoptosis-inducing factor 3
MPGGNLKNIFTLRSVDDANQIALNAKGKDVVILGNSFIGKISIVKHFTDLINQNYNLGMESAAYFAEKATSVTVVGRSSVPFEPVLGKEVGARVLQIFTEAKVQHLGGKNFVSFSASEADPESVGGVQLDDGQVLKADVVVLGIGSTAATDPFKGQVNMDPRGNIPVDEVRNNNFNNVNVCLK